MFVATVGASIHVVSFNIFRAVVMRDALVARGGPALRLFRSKLVLFLSEELSLFTVLSSALLESRRASSFWNFFSLGVIYRAGRGRRIFVFIIVEASHQIFDLRFVSVNH